MFDTHTIHTRIRKKETNISSVCCELLLITNGQFVPVKWQPVFQCTRFTINLRFLLIFGLVNSTFFVDRFFFLPPFSVCWFDCCAHAIWMFHVHCKILANFLFQKVSHLRGFSESISVFYFYLLLGMWQTSVHNLNKCEQYRKNIFSVTDLLFSDSAWSDRFFSWDLRNISVGMFFYAYFHN